VEVQIDDPLGLAWDEPALAAPDEVRPPRPAELEVLRLLYKAGFLLGSQLARELGWESDRTARQALLRLVQYGWIARFRFRVRERGPQPFVYVLRDAGFRVAREHVSRHGPYVAPDEGWSAPQVKDPRRVLHDLHAAGWVLAAQGALTPKIARTWHGARARLARPAVPTRGREERHPIRAGEIAPARDVRASRASTPAAGAQPLAARVERHPTAGGMALHHFTGGSSLFGIESRPEERAAAILVADVDQQIDGLVEALGHSECPHSCAASRSRDCPCVHAIALKRAQRNTFGTRMNCQSYAAAWLNRKRPSGSRETGRVDTAFKAVRSAGSY
jgi:hypothetical protein